MATPIPLFRRQALEHHRARGLASELVVLDHGATHWGFALLCAGMLALLLFATLGHVNEYATGPAFVQLDGRTPLTAESAGLVSSVAVKPGDSVQLGDELVRFHAAEELAELQAASLEFERQLAKLLLRPGDPVTREALLSLRSRRDLAQQRSERRVLRAPQAGIVGDVRVRPGQLVEPGMRVVDLQSAASAATVTALLPGRYRPLLHAGDTLRFELDGFHHVAHELRVSQVGEQIVGPTEAARFVGSDLADAISISGPVVLVTAKLPAAHFTLDGQPYEFATGMFGKAEAVVRNEAIAYAIVPSLKQWVERMMGDDAEPRAEVSHVQ
ncbi:MAG TPA: HlyD family efflux transporter periplasmic adaptor subunit [Polyangiales bacterium]|nr:HlyD family efflux transporter periplasmic adaptor subunit [Polyangiales bacterium]